NSEMRIEKYDELGNTYGSDLRDKSMILQNMTLMEKKEDAINLVKEISKALSGDSSYSTQTTAFALMAVSEYFGINSPSSKFSFEIIQNGKSQIIESSTPIYKKVLTDIPLSGSDIEIANREGGVLYGVILCEGVPEAGFERESSNGLKISEYHLTKQYSDIVDSNYKQGSDLIINITVKNTTPTEYENLVLTEIVPSGWEIHNARLDNNVVSNGDVDYQDIRDDRIFTYFNLKPWERKTFQVLLNASYLGKYYKPGVSVEAMYNPKISANTVGKWITVKK
ncbi:MAG: hypothetical protein GY714_24705, partial [Desulfobacterales bacterium]|nr:hypothetical protein [Desulfobacterales bacterium]